MDTPPPASLALDQLGIPHRLFIHGTPVNSFEEAASARGQRPEQIVRSILFQIREGEFLMVLMAGPGQIDWKKLRQLVKRSRIRMATEEEVLEVTGYRIGTVSPFGLRTQARPEFDRRVKVKIDASVFREEEISIGSGIRNVAIIMKSSDVQKALGDAEIVELAESS
jgi:prolyl-tRNA editing enzyme YbaK/EbsC (Cys-tRNA(Pro) deacylase)